MHGTWVRWSAPLILLALSLAGPWADAGDAAAGYADPMRRAVQHLTGSQQASGFMAYAFDFLEDSAAEPGAMSPVNLTRQAATAAVLADYYALTKDPGAAEASRRLLDALAARSLPLGKRRMQSWVEATRLLSAPVGRYKIHAALRGADLLYQTSGPGKVISPNADYDGAYTGIVALALLTELRYAKAGGDGRFADLRRAWVEALIMLHIPGDGFRQIPSSIDTAAYYDGESWLALAEYQHAFPGDARVGDLLRELDVAMVEKYGRKFDMMFYHWGAMAAAARYADTGDEQLLHFIRTQLQAYLTRMKGRYERYNTCAGIEGVADAINALAKAGEADSALFAQARQWTAIEMQKAMQLQIQPGQTELVFPNARISAPRMPEFAGSFRSGIYAADTQIDYTAHCTSAMVKLTRHGLQLGGLPVGR